ncbi:MAG: hypothetical protein WAO15_06950 [Mycobacterium sp.]
MPSASQPVSQFAHQMPNATGAQNRELVVAQKSNRATVCSVPTRFVTATQRVVWLL